MLMAYADGSATGGIRAVGLLLSPADRWDRCTPIWDTTTKELGVYPFHMTDFVEREKNRERRELVVNKLATLLCDASCLAMAMSVNEADWALLPRRYQVRLGTEYQLLATGVMAKTTAWLRAIGSPDSYAGVFEAGDEGQGPFREAIMRILNSLPSAREHFGIETFVFDTKARSALQMADLFAWTVSHWVPKLRIADPLAKIVVGHLKRRTCYQSWWLDKSQLLVASGHVPEGGIPAFKRRHGIGVRRQRKRHRG